TASALVLEVVALGRANRLRIDALGEPRHERGSLVQAVVEARRLEPGLPPPANGATVDVVHVQHLRPTVDDALLDGIAEIAPGDRGSRIAEDVRAIGLRFVVASRESVLEREPIHERLAAVIDGARAWPVARGERIDLCHRRAGAIEQAIPLVADLVIEDHELAEVAALRRHDRRLPAGAEITPGSRSEVTGAFRPQDPRAEEPVRRLHACRAMTVEVVRALRLLLRHPPLVGSAPAGANDRGRIGGDRRSARLREVQRRAMEVDARWLAVCQIVSEVDPQALALVDPEHERLDGVALKTERDSGVRAVGPRC